MRFMYSPYAAALCQPRGATCKATANPASASKRGHARLRCEASFHHPSSAAETAVPPWSDEPLTPQADTDDGRPSGGNGVSPLLAISFAPRPAARAHLTVPSDSTPTGRRNNYRPCGHGATPFLAGDAPCGGLRC